MPSASAVVARQVGTGRESVCRWVLRADVKPVARLHFDGPQKYLGLLDENKEETQHPLESHDEIYEHAGEIREAVARYA